MTPDNYWNLLKALWPLHRTLVSDDMDVATAMVSDFASALGVPGENNLIHEFPSGSEVSTWIIPKKYTLRDYLLEEKGATTPIIDKSSPPLSIPEYSLPVDEVMDFEELRPHLFYSERQPDAIPFVFKFMYRPNFGFCLPKTRFDRMSSSSRYRTLIDAESSDGALKCLEIIIPGRTDDSILVMSNLCHPWQVNDSITGAINALMLIEHYLANPPKHTLRFGFWPETIGAQAYFSKYYAEKGLFRYALFTEMLGTPGDHALQLSRQETSSIDCAARFVLERKAMLPYTAGRYTTLLRNDERVSNGVNLDIPTISLSRWPYPEYHTSNDNPDIIDMKRIEESSRVTQMIIDTLDTNVYLEPEGIYGQPFLTRYGLFHDSSRAGGTTPNLNKITEDVFSYSDGNTSLLDIAFRFGHDPESVRLMAKGLVEKGLFKEKKKCAKP